MAETSTLVTFVAAGLGVAVVPEPVAELGVAGATYRPLVGGARMDLLAVTRRDDDSAALARTLAVLRAQHGGPASRAAVGLRPGAPAVSCPAHPQEQSQAVRSASAPCRPRC